MQQKSNKNLAQFKNHSYNAFSSVISNSAAHSSTQKSLHASTFQASICMFVQFLKVTLQHLHPISYAFGVHAVA
ncbi:Uncharacterised protein [Enterobacter ludwigii]|jgi:hypothetical protein|nr:hypothetical protein EcloH_1395 [Enterobacter ludwigii]MDR6368262.1 hypothetical protein [Enterobacter sp. SORGH_AS_0287]MBB2845835.1 hypothetical protein [Enterobacter ludwigii]CAH0227041.1 hypothetical protein SRABI45_02384 [Enterobacter ludwigii]VAG30745.1 Uncharacterised protein [Enterobacter ludwigii]